MSDAVPSLSIVIEWENAGRIGAERAGRMLRALHSQFAELGAGAGGGHEIILLHDPRTVRRDVLVESLHEAGADWPAEIIYAAVPGHGYYRQKNAGAALARNDIIIFLDSDVVPEPGWLRGLAGPLGSPDVDVVCGNTYVDPDSFYAAAMALGWIFPLRSTEHGLVRSQSFCANNFAIRRAVFARHPFPETGQYRGQCGFLAEDLIGSGHNIYLNRDAQVAHPPPYGLKQFVIRALWGGYDDRIRRRLRAQHLAGRGTRGLTRKSGAYLMRIFRDRRRVQLSLGGAVVAAGIAILYQGLRMTAYLTSKAAPKLVRRSLERVET
jgi:glycosyltransferase involved in cell wall biosynthesis